MIIEIINCFQSFDWSRGHYVSADNCLLKTVLSNRLFTTWANGKSNSEQHSGIAFTICTNQFYLPKNGREGLIQRWVWRNGTRISLWNNSSGKSRLPFQMFFKFSAGTTQKSRSIYFLPKMVLTTNARTLILSSFRWYKSFRTGRAYQQKKKVSQTSNIIIISS